MSFPDQQPTTGSIYVHGPEQQHFGHPSTWPAQTSPPQMPPTFPVAPRRRRRIFIGAMTTVVVLILAAGAALAYVLTRPDAKDPLSSANLIKACQEATTRQLKSPSSAKFSEDNPSIDGARGVVAGVVDAQNGFGAMLRKRYYCIATRGDKMWLVSSVTLSDWP